MTLCYVPIPAFQDNYIWAVSDGRHVLIVDPGDSAPVIAFCHSMRLRIGAILLTHHHLDHVGGVGDLLSSDLVDPDIEVYGPARENVQHVTRKLHDGDSMAITQPAFSARVLDVPGHTSGHIAYFQDAIDDAPPHLFCGDTLFASGCGRLFEGTPGQMLESLDRLASLDGATEVHCAHEYTLSNIDFSVACDPSNADIVQWQKTARALREAGRPTLPTTIAHENRVNPFLRCGEQSLQATLVSEFALASTDRLAAFTLLRSWKNNF